MTTNQIYKDLVKTCSMKYGRQSCKDKHAPTIATTQEYFKNDLVLKKRLLGKYINVLVSHTITYIIYLLLN